jgi:hypothetical protein
VLKSKKNAVVSAVKLTCLMLIKKSLRRSKLVIFYEQTTLFQYLLRFVHILPIHYFTGNDYFNFISSYYISARINISMVPFHIWQLITT